MYVCICVRGCGGVMIKCDDGLVLHCSHDERERGSLTSPPRLRDLAPQVYTLQMARTYLRTRHPLLQTDKLLTLYLFVFFLVLTLSPSAWEMLYNYVAGVPIVYTRVYATRRWISYIMGRLDFIIIIVIITSIIYIYIYTNIKMIQFVLNCW